MDESGTRAAVVLPMAQLATCVLATALGFFYVVDALRDAPASWPGLSGVYALVVLIVTMVDVVRERVVAARR